MFAAVLNLVRDQLDDEKNTEYCWTAFVISFPMV